MEVEKEKESLASARQENAATPTVGPYELNVRRLKGGADRLDCDGTPTQHLGVLGF